MGRAAFVMSDHDAFAFASVLGEKRQGFIQITQATGDGPGDFKVVEKLAELSGCPILYNVVFSLDGVPQFHRGVIKWIEDCQRRGLRIFGQGQTVRATYYFSLADWNLYDTSPASHTGG